MKHWQETAASLSEVARLTEAGKRAAVATVIRIRGSAYRRPGAKLLVREDGTTSGSVSGGCLEADVREVALTVMRDGRPRLLHYDTSSDDRVVFGLGLGCNGAVDIFVQLASTPAFARSAGRISELLGGDEAFSVTTVLGGDAAGRTLVVAADGAPSGSTGDPALDEKVARRAAELMRRGEAAVHETDALQLFTEVLTPPPRLVVFGAGDDALPLARYAQDVGFRVAVVDHRPAALSDGQFPDEIRRFTLRPEQGVSTLPLGPRTFAVVKTHSLGLDREWVRKLLRTEVPYIGVLGPRARIEEILRQVEAARDGRVFGPVGLDVGTDGPEQVAVSVVAELLAVKAGRAGRHLRDREGPIHAP
ncbi:MAG TPA: XdhC family protein [Anaeromyxobacter sp.]|nr:XdhC family protein [Anaeromyxobacter sp.]